MDYPTAFLFFVCIAISSIHPGSCVEDEDLRNMYIFYSIIYLAPSILFAISGIVTGIVISCYICKCCPMAKRQRQEGTILSLPQHGGPMLQPPRYQLVLAGHSDYPQPPTPAPPYYSPGQQQYTSFPMEVKEPHINC